MTALLIRVSQHQRQGLVKGSLRGLEAPGVQPHIDGLRILPLLIALHMRSPSFDLLAGWLHLSLNVRKLLLRVICNVSSRYDPGFNFEIAICVTRSCRVRRRSRVVVVALIRTAHPRLVKLHAPRSSGLGVLTRRERYLLEIDLGVVLLICVRRVALPQQTWYYLI